MTGFNPEEIGLKVGLEIHQQLNTKAKLFCNCQPMDESNFTCNFLRRLRPTQSELGQVDPAALFEFKKGMMIKYSAGKQSACLVEADEEPPHNLNPEAVESALLIALALNAKPVDEIHVMRKIVIDGSNTTGFQRTVIIALGGSIKVNDKVIPVQTISLEEDAARLMGEDQQMRVYGLDRLCIPLVEVALAPITAIPQEVEEVALALGRLMRSTGRAARGLGTIRQDVNVSLGGQGVIEVKGVQKLNLLAKIVEFEVRRQSGLIKIGAELRKRGVKPEDIRSDPVDVTSLFKTCSNKVLVKTIDTNGRILAVRLSGFRGLMSFEPYSDVRLGREMAELVRFYGLGGIFHSDELPGYGISESEVKELGKMLMVGEEDGFAVLAGGKEVSEAASALIRRAREAISVIPAETRGPTDEGKTRFIRPRPGAARMYPETDIPSMSITREMVERVRRLIPKPWEEQVKEYMVHYGLSDKLAFQIYDSEHSVLFKRLASTTKVSPSFIAAALTETLVSLTRMGLDTSTLREETLEDLFTAIDRGALSKEAVPLVLEKLLRGDAKNVDEAAKHLALQMMPDDELRRIVRKVVDDNKQEVYSKGEQSFSLLMGRVMAVVRGKADGRKVSIILKEEINRAAEEGKKKLENPV